MFKKLRSSVSKLKRVFKTEDSRFIAKVGLKVTGISFGIAFVVYWFLFEIMRLNYLFFKVHGFPEFSSDSVFFDHIYAEVLDKLPLLFAFHVFLFFIGSYVGWLMLRPFRTMGDYCESTLDNINAVYIVDQFSTYGLLTRFSEFFFEYLRESRKKLGVVSNSIPPQYSKIHKPVVDYVFMLHFGLLLIIISIATAVFITETTSMVYGSMVELAAKTLKDHNGVSRYLGEQIFILDDIIGLTIILIALCYTLLGLHLYQKVSGAAFGIFSTMRSFMKGNYSSRVHLLGYGYIREHTRKLNKYLDYIQNNFVKERPKN